VPHNTTKMK